MASPSTRSSRRSEGLTTRSTSTIIHLNSAHNRQAPPSNTSRRKRPRDSSEKEQDQIEFKKQRNTIEVASRLKAQTKARSLVNNSDAKLQHSTQNKPATQTIDTKPRPPTTHSNKVLNGIKHELDRLQPSASDKKDEKRKLRSQEGTRFKSELSAYFPDYDVVIGNEPEETHFLNIDTPIIVVDSKPPITKPHQANSPKSRHTNGVVHRSAVRSFPGSLFDSLHQSQRVDFTFLDRRFQGEPHPDPLPDGYYDLAHRRAERLERSIRNSEKGRAQHEKDQVIRLLEGLQGHDWLKVMGVSGITESKKKDYEPARSHFVRGCLAILEKFRTWREEEKRRKQEKEMALAEAAEEEEEEGNQSDGDPPDYSDVDHAAARQLHEEAIARSAPLTPSKPEKRAKVVLIAIPAPAPAPAPAPESVSASAPALAPTPQPEKEFLSFFAKPHLREAALGKRRSGRSAAAWGQPVPEIPELDFNLPEELRDKETLEASARRKRRSRRESKE